MTTSILLLIVTLILHLAEEIRTGFREQSITGEVPLELFTLPALLSCSYGTQNRPPIIHTQRSQRDTPLPKLAGSDHGHGAQ
jgi:hypothetical protein